MAGAGRYQRAVDPAHRRLPPDPSRGGQPSFGLQPSSDKDRKGRHRSLLIDPMLIALAQEHMEYGTTHTRFGMMALREMAKVPWVETIITALVNFVAMYGKPKYGPSDTGFDVKTKERKHTPSKAERAVMDEIREFVSNCGTYGDRYERYDPHRDRFERFLRKTVRDSLTFDAMPWEIVRNQWTGKPTRFLHVDAGSIWFCRPQDESGDFKPDHAAFVQRYHDQNWRYFAADEMFYGIRRPTADIESAGYGSPELEVLAMILTGILYGFAWNMNFFRNGGVDGLLAAMGKMPRDQFDDLKRDLLYQATGVRNAHRLILANVHGEGADFKWVPTGANPSDGQFSEWNRTLYYLMCNIFEVEPDLVGAHDNATGSSAMFEKGPDAKIKLGKAKALYPLLRTIEYGMNNWIIDELWPDFEVHLASDDGMTEQEREDLSAKRVSKRRTLNEERALNDEPALPWGDVVLDPIAYQAYQASQQPQGQPGMPGPGEPAPGPEEPGPDDQAAAEAGGEAASQRQAERGGEEPPPPEWADDLESKGLQMTRDAMGRLTVAGRA